MTLSCRLASLTLLAGLFAACGSSGDGALYQGGNGSPGTGGSSGGSDASSGGAAGSMMTGSGGDDGSSRDGGQLGSGGSSGFGGIAPDASAAGGAAATSDASDPGGGRMDAAARGDVTTLPETGEPTPGVAQCAGAPCILSGAPNFGACCVGAPPFPIQCLPTVGGACANGGIPVRCDDASDCAAGQVCCGQLVFGPAGGTGCVDQCGLDGDSVQLCRTNAECMTGSCTPVPNSEYSSCQ